MLTHVQKVESVHTWLRLRLAELPVGGLRFVVNQMLSQNGGAFWCWPASTSKHHVYEGGLAVHTAEVLYGVTHGAIEATTEMRVAALIHDSMKVWDYQAKKQEWSVPEPVNGIQHSIIVPKTLEWEKTKHARHLYHISYGAMEFHRLVNNLGDGGYDLNHIEHMILAHHGQASWGSPVEPQTPEAYLLHAADMLSLKAGYTSETAEPRLGLYTELGWPEKL